MMGCHLVGYLLVESVLFLYWRLSWVVNKMGETCCLPAMRRSIQMAITTSEPHTTGAFLQRQKLMTLMFFSICPSMIHSFLREPEVLYCARDLTAVCWETTEGELVRHIPASVQTEASSM